MEQKDKDLKEQDLKDQDLKSNYSGFKDIKATYTGYRWLVGGYSLLKLVGYLLSIAAALIKLIAQWIDSGDISADVIINRYVILGAILVALGQLVEVIHKWIVEAEKIKESEKNSIKELKDTIDGKDDEED
ncbi:hypothetical protein [Priestia megaterium]|uniref:hypothetical protein n=1 Tax=Priestia megaterium TaxID=1404 RepID=UPI0005C6DB28|nr:hypothetical protein [Priestia megaterium]